MDHEHLAPRLDFFQEKDDHFSSLQNEFSKIFYENNLQSFAKPSELGLLELGKLREISSPTGDSDDIRSINLMDTSGGRLFQKGESSPYLNMGMQNSYSPMRFLPQNSISNFNQFGGGFQSLPSFQEASFYRGYSPYKTGGQDYQPYEYSDQQQGYAYQMYDQYNQSYNIDPQQNNVSLMWSNETKGLKSTSVEEIPPSPPKQASTSKKIIISHEEKTMKKTKPVKIEHEIEKISNKTFAKEQTRIPKPETISVVAPRRTTRTTKPLFNNTDLNDDSGSDDDKDESYGDGKNRSSRGLRVLSQKVREIVLKKKKTSYKEVADALLQDLNQKMKGKSHAEIAKEEQNVKRRVYDALNVLIAAEILKKEGKLVCCESGNTGGNQSKKKQKNDKKEKSGDKEKLKQQIEETKKRRNEKVENLQQLVRKSLAMKNLIQRNKEKIPKVKQEEKITGVQFVSPTKAKTYSQFSNAEGIKVNNEAIKPQSSTAETISFPFLVLVSSSSENNINLNMSNGEKRLDIESSKEFHVYGDIDILLKMNLQQVSPEMLDKEVPKDLQRYVLPLPTNE